MQNNSRYVTRRQAIAATVGIGMMPVLAGCAGEKVMCKAVERMAAVTGPEITTKFRMEATDLGIPITTADDRILCIFGDTFEEAYVGGGFWRSPVGLYADPDSVDTGITWTSAVGGETAKQLVDYAHDDGTLSTILPADVIVVDGVMYLWVMVNAGLGNVLHTEIWTSKDSGESWERTTKMFAKQHMGGLMQQCTWALDDTGDYVYLLTTGFQRDKTAIAARVLANQILEPSAYEVYQGDGTWGSNNPVEIIPGQVGEMCLRRIEGSWVLTWFNAGDYRVDARKADTLVGLHEASSVTLLHGGSWDHESDDTVAQLYGPYMLPGSSLTTLHLLVSQWNTDHGWPYHVEQFKIMNPFAQSCAD